MAIQERRSREVVLLGAAVLAMTASGPTLHFRFGGMMFWVIVVASAVMAARAAHISDRTAPRTALWTILAVAVAMRLSLLFVEPYLSSDIFRYIWDGRVQAAGINPYRFIPAAPELAFLRDSVIYPQINRADYARTIYPPAAQIAFLAVTRLSESVVAMKLALLGFEVLAVASMIAILRRLGKPMIRVAAYAWHPLPVWEIAASGHIDAAMLGLMLLALSTCLAGRTLVAGALAGVAALFKPTALLALPVFWRPWSLKLPLVVGGIICVLYLPYVGVGWRVFGFLQGYLEEEGLLSGGGFWYLTLLEQATGPIANGVRLYVLIAGALLVLLALSVGFRADRSPEATVHSVGLLVTVFLLLLTPHYPWYYLALVPFLAIGRAAATPWVLTVGALQIHHAIPGDWLPDYALRQSVFHLAALAAVAYDLRRGYWRAERPLGAVGEAIGAHTSLR